MWFAEPLPRIHNLNFKKSEMQQTRESHKKKRDTAQEVFVIKAIESREAGSVSLTRTTGIGFMFLNTSNRTCSSTATRTSILAFL
jgi:hypothetical protein